MTQEKDYSQITIRQLNRADDGFEQTLSGLLAFDQSTDASVTEAVRRILADVRERGDQALLDYTSRFDRLQACAVSQLEISLDECREALANLPKAQRKALKTAARRITLFHEIQNAAARVSDFEMADEYNSVMGQKIIPLDSVGVYVPGGKAAYPSSVLMNAIPARVAGVKNIIMTVPTPDGAKNPLVLAAAALSGVTRVFMIGGAQAVGALAYGTETVPKVDKITGPGNAYVAEAKRTVFGTVGIDMIAGPSELCVICDGKTDPDWTALDLFSQAEHDQLAQSILVCPDEAYIGKVIKSIRKLLPQMPRRDIIAASLENRGIIIQVADLNEACEVANMIAPEHLEISVSNPMKYLGKIRHAGSVFLGRYTAEPLGDYCAGPNHVLPTSGTARFSSALGVADFQKRTQFLMASKVGAAFIGVTARELAEGEGLSAHAASAHARYGSGKPAKEEKKAGKKQKKSKKK